MSGVLPGPLQQLLDAGGNKLPPVHTWHPPLSGDIAIRIARDGTWYHEGERMTRHALVRLFSTLLRREGDEFFLVTPVEKWRLTVEDAPFIAIDCEAAGNGEDQQLVFTTNVDDRVLCDAQHPLRVVADPLTGQPSPCVTVRDCLEARLARSVFYRLVDSAVEREGTLGVYSGGVFHALGVRG